MRLCGISSRFQLLSPCVRQVAHALLTRPPLSHNRLPPEGFCLLCFVRLACVRHAASVHPEPGSNSLKKFFLPVLLALLYPLIPLLFFGLLLLHSESASSVQITLPLPSFKARPFYSLCNDLDSILKILFIAASPSSERMLFLESFKVILLFSYQGSVGLCRFFSQATTSIYYHSCYLLSIPFFIFFYFFLISFDHFF